MKPNDLTPEEDRQFEHTVEFEMNYCRHYEPKPGMKRGELDCAAGVDRKTLPEVPRTPGVLVAPCIGGHNLPDPCAICPKWERHTREDGEKRALGVLRSMRKMTVAGPFIAAWRRKEPRGKAEVVECPVCKGRLHLSQSSYNGHVHGRCETADCLNWME
jgi:hypothetical protein